MDFLRPTVCFWLLFLLLALNDSWSVNGDRLQYSRNELLQLKYIVLADVSDITAQIPDRILKLPNTRTGGDKRRERRRRRKRGKRGGVQLRMRKLRLNRVPLPSMILGNAQSLRNKMDELQGNVRFLKDFKDGGILTFTESWTRDLLIDGFGAPLHLDRDAEVTGKSQGGGVCLYVNQRYCHPKPVTVRELICTPDVELLCVSLRPFYLPREFPQLFITTVYLHPKANVSSACSVIHGVVQKLQSVSPDAPIFVLGDFNHVSLKKTLPDFYQYVTCPTRRDKTIDLCYGSVKEAYKSLPLPPVTALVQ